MKRSGPKPSPKSGWRQKCKVADCERTVGRGGSHGMCTAHVSRMRANTNLMEPWRGSLTGGMCPILGCTRTITTKGCCTFHYARRRAGIPDSHPFKKRRIRKERQKGSDGYMMLLIDGKKVLEHRHVMSEKLERPLFSHETVHHKNGVRSDNRPKNLELWSHSHPYGQRVVDKIQWAIAFLKQYGKWPNV